MVSLSKIMTQIVVNCLQMPSLSFLLHFCVVLFSEIGSLASLDACKSGASSDVREPISLHQAVRQYYLFGTSRA